METIAVIRDIAIIFLALLNIALIAVLLFIAIIIWRLFRKVSREAPELIDRAKAMTTTAQGTVDFVGSTVARPAITVAAFLAGLQRFLRIITVGNRSAASRRQPNGRQETRI